MRRIDMRVALARLLAGLVTAAAVCAWANASNSTAAMGTAGMGTAAMGTAVKGTAAMGTAAEIRITAAAAAGAGATVVASHLNQPKKITIAANGDLIVALSGDGKAPSTCRDANERSCVDRSGAIDEITPSGKVVTLLNHLVSIAEGDGDPQATGPVEARENAGKLQVLFQGVTINATTGQEIYGAAGAMLSDLVAFTQSATTGSTSTNSAHTEAELGPFEAKNNPDEGAGTDVQYGDDVAVDSDPYAFVPYKGGYAIADAGANDVLFLSPTGKLSVLAVLPTITETAPAKTFGSSQTTAIQAQAQGVPTSLAVGPDGALYVGELGGMPFALNTESVYRVVPGRAPTVYARGFTMVGDVAFDSRGRLLVLEIDRKGLGDPGLGTGSPAGGELIRVAKNGAKTVVAWRGLDFPTGMAVANDGSVYISNDGTTPADSGHGGEILRLRLTG